MKVDETNKRALTWERHIKHAKMKMVGIQAVYLIALNIFQYRERIRHLFITVLENDTKYLRRKNKFIYRPDSSMLVVTSSFIRVQKYPVHNHTLLFLQTVE